MAQTPETVLKQLKQGQYSPIYFLHGEESYYIDLIANYIENNALNESERGFNQMVLYGGETDLQTILNQARRYPMMANRQVLIVKEAQKLNEFKKQEGRDTFQKYLDNPQPSTILVFCHKYNTLDKRYNLSKEIDEKAILIDSKKIWDNQLPDWIESYIRGRNYQIEEKAVHMLADYIGNDLNRMANEIEKILINHEYSDNSDNKVIIRPEEVQQYVGISKEFNNFELQKAIAQRNVKKAMQITSFFAANPKDNPVIPIIALLFGFYSRLLKFYSLSSQNDQQIMSALKISKGRVYEYKQGGKAYNRDRVIQNIHFLRHADMQTKGIGYGQINEGEILKELVFKLIY